MTSKYNPKISPKNKFYAQKVRDLTEKYNCIGIIDVESLPAPQFQKIRASISKTGEVLIVKKNIISLVLDELNKKKVNILGLKEKMVGVVGLIFTNDNPFTLYKFIKKNKSSAPAKAGSIAPKDIIVPAGPTNFAPGPIIGELGAFKIKAGISAGKVEIKEDSLVVKEGEPISGALAGILSRLGIEPMEVGLNIKAIYEGGTIYDRKILDVDEEAILNDLKSEALNAFKLSIGLKYFTKENISNFLGEASRDSLGLGVGITYPAVETIKNLCMKANAHASGVAQNLPEDIRPAGLVSSNPVPTSNNVGNEESKKTEEKKEEPKVDASAGLGSLF